MSTIFSDIVNVNGVVFNDPGALPVGAVIWGLDDLSGWDSTSDIEIQTSLIGGAIDGEEIARDSPARARYITAGGYVMGADRASAETIKDVLWRDAFPRNDTLRLVRNEPVPKFVDVRVAGRKQFLMVGPFMYRWLVPLVAGDPFKYGSTALSGSTGAAGQSTGGRTYPRRYPMTYGTVVAGEGNALVLFNSGTVPSRKLTLTITGPLNNGSWRISQETTGQSLSFDVDVATTDTLVIDFKAGVATLNGYPIGSSIVGDFFALEPGENIIKLFADFNAAITMSAVGYSAWE